MDKLDLDNKVLVFGKTSFNSVNLKGMTKDEFTKNYSGILRGENMKDVWKEVSKYCKEDAVSKTKKSK